MTGKWYLNQTINRVWSTKSIWMFGEKCFVADQNRKKWENSLRLLIWKSVTYGEEEARKREVTIQNQVKRRQMNAR